MQPDVATVLGYGLGLSGVTVTGAFALGHFGVVPVAGGTMLVPLAIGGALVSFGLGQSAMDMRIDEAQAYQDKGGAGRSTDFTDTKDWSTALADRSRLREYAFYWAGGTFALSLLGLVTLAVLA